MQVIVDGLMTNYEKVGSGKTILCLPGWGDTILSFRKLSDELRNNYAVIALDLPGFGGTQPPSRAWGLEDYAMFTASFLKKINRRKPFGIIGHSYGGATAIVSVGKGFIDCEKLILLASSGIRDQNSSSKRLLRGFTKVAKLPLFLLSSSSKKKLRKRLYSAVGSDMMLLPHMEPTFRKIINEDVRPFAEAVNAETLLVYGSKDSQTPVSYGHLLNNALPNSTLEVIEGADHLIQLNNVDKVAALVKQFLRKTS